MGLLSAYIKDEWVPNIKAYKYKGTDYSLFYRFMISPLCNKIVLLIPADVT